MLKAAVKRLESNEVPAELAQWEEALASYHRLQPEVDRANNIKQNVIPDLEAAYDAKKGEHEQAKVEAERVSLTKYHRRVLSR
jgi:septation ring formation regulator EzrA